MGKIANEADKNRPNLYSYAKDERSQDAFISWLIHWASPKFKNAHPELHACGVKFIDALYADKVGINKPTEYKSIKIFNQQGHIDIFVLLNDAEYAIIIEDKTHTKNHSTQLADYLDFVTMDEKGVKIPKENVLPIYLKTGDQSSYKEISDNKYFEFLRKDFLKVLRDGKSNGVDNHIFNDFLDHLENIEYKVNRYRSEQISTWANKNFHREWSGFFMALQKEMSGGWKYVSNLSGGFMCFWWASRIVGDIKLSLHLAEKLLCFKIMVTSGKRTALRNDWQKRICKAAKEYKSSLIINKPAKFGSGTHMTVAVLKSDYLIPDDNNVLNLSETKKIMKECEAILDFAINQYNE